MIARRRRMNRREFLAASAALAAAPALSEGATGSRVERAQDDTFVVHEWGVVTIAQSRPLGMARSEGASFVDGLEKAEALPEFVTTYEKAFGKALTDWHNMPVRKPVLYFHANRVMDVRVRVQIPKGRPYAWWPAADYAPRPNLPPKKGIRIQGDDSEPKLPKVDDMPMEKGALSWAITLDPKASQFADAAGWWKLARAPKATPVVAGQQSDKFLFYDALTTFDPGLDIAWAADGSPTIAAAGAIPALFAVRVKDGVCKSAATKMVKGDRVTLALEKGRPDLAAALAKAGLNQDEADAVAEIWKEEFFEAAGARVLAFVPREVYDALLPIEIEPRPSKLERVLIAHIECLDPDRRPQIDQWIDQLASESLDERDAAAAELKKAGPLAEKAIRDAIDKPRDAEVKARLMELLKKR